MALLTKVIKPKRMKVDALRLELLNEMRRVGKEIQKDFEKTTETWDHKPKFELVISLTGPGPVILVGTDDPIYRYVDEGTKPHLIWAGYYTGKSDKRVLAFPGTFTAKTVPGVIGSRQGSSKDVPNEGKVKTPYVQHPGTKPRKFDEAIKAKWEKAYRARMEAAMKRAAKASGHGV